jgi:hypothetical protein
VEDCAALNELRNLRVTVLVTHSNITDPRIEPVDSAVARESLRTAFACAERYRVVLYWRPLVPQLNDTEADLALAAELSGSAHATVFTGLFFREQIRAYYREMGCRSRTRSRHGGRSCRHGWTGGSWTTSPVTRPARRCSGRHRAPSPTRTVWPISTATTGSGICATSARACSNGGARLASAGLMPRRWPPRRPISARLLRL